MWLSHYTNNFGVKWFVEFLTTTTVSVGIGRAASLGRVTTLKVYTDLKIKVRIETVTSDIPSVLNISGGTN